MVGPTAHTEFKDIKIHTAKCDTCNMHNKDIMKQCMLCGQNYCTPCFLKGGVDGLHVLNSGDRGYAAAEARRAAKTTRARSLDLLAPKKEKSSRMKVPSPRPQAKTRRTRRRTVVVEESESEVGGLDGDEMSLDDTETSKDDEQEQLKLESPPQASNIRCGKLREVPVIATPVRDQHMEAARLHDDASTLSDRSVLKPAYDENDTQAANNLLDFANGVHDGTHSNNLTPVHSEIALHTLSRIDFSACESGSGSKMIYNSALPNYTNGMYYPSQTPNKQNTLTSHWRSSPNNSMGIPNSQQVHPYPKFPEVTSTIIGHDSEGKVPQNGLYGDSEYRLHPVNQKTRRFTHTLDKHTQQFMHQEPLFIDPTSNEEHERFAAASADVPDDTMGCRMGSTGLTNSGLNEILSKYAPGYLDEALSRMEPGMDDRGQRIFGHEAESDVYFNPVEESYIEGAGQYTEEHHAEAKANLNRRPIPRFSRLRHTVNDFSENEASEEGEIQE